LIISSRRQILQVGAALVQVLKELLYANKRQAVENIYIIGKNIPYFISHPPLGALDHAKQEI
jgi:hypothetical protein